MMMIVHCKVTIPKTFYEVHPKHQNIIYIHEGILNLEHISHVSWLAVTVPQEDCRLENCVMLRLGKFLLESLPKNISRVIIPRVVIRKKKENSSTNVHLSSCCYVIRFPKSICSSKLPRLH